MAPTSKPKSGTKKGKGAAKKASPSRKGRPAGKKSGGPSSKKKYGQSSGSKYGGPSSGKRSGGKQSGKSASKTSSTSGGTSSAKSKKKRGKRKFDPRGKMPPAVQKRFERRKAKEAAGPDKAEVNAAEDVARAMARTRLRPPVEPDLGIDTHHAGYVALVGRPNVGKSTILNALLGQKIAATTHKPQTTRRNLLGVLHPKGAQVLLLDTPGHHRAKGPLNRYMVGQVRSAIRDADVVAYVVEARNEPKVTPGNERILGELQKSDRPIVLIINKIDTVAKKKNLLFLIDLYMQHLGDRIKAVVPISAMRRNGLDRAVKELALALPEAEPIVATDQFTDATERGIVAEMIREKVILETRDELPYAAAVNIEGFEDKRPRLVRILATIHVERGSQKAIVIGRGGERLKTIGQRARKDIEVFLDSKVYLDIRVKTTTRWTERRDALAELGYEGGGA